MEALKLKVTEKPFKYLVTSDKNRNIVILAFLIPQIAMLFITKSYRSLAVLLAAVLASLSVELLDMIHKKKSFYNFLTAVITGILTGLFFPKEYPLPGVFFITFLTMFICFNFLGKYADSWVNTVALTVSIAWILGSSIFPSYLISQELLLTRNPALELIQNGTVPLISLDTKITNFLNHSIFSLFGVSIPDGYVSFFWDTKSSIAAFRFNFITLVTSIILFATDIIKPLIPGIFILVYSLLVYFAGPFFYSGTIGQGDLLLALLTSGLLLSCLFLLQHAGTTPLTTPGKIIYGIISGIFGFFIIGAGTSPSGAVFTVLVMNVISPIIQQFEGLYEHYVMKKELLEKAKEIRDGKNA